MILTYLTRWFPEPRLWEPVSMIPLCDPDRCTAAGCVPTACRGAGVASNDEMFARSAAVIPGGVNSSIRAFKSVGGRPYVVAHAHGAHLWDVEGTRYIDLVQSYGAVILGHAHPAITAAIRDVAGDGTSYGAPTPPRDGGFRRGDRRTRPVVRAAAVHELGHRGRGHRRPAGTRLHRSRPGGDLPRQLPRRHRCPARRRWQRRRHTRAARHRGRAPGQVRWPRRSSSRTTWCPRSTGSVACVMVEPIAADVGLVAPAARLPRGVAGRVRPGRRRVGVRRGDQAVSGSGRAGPSGDLESRPTSPRSAR